MILLIKRMQSLGITNSSIQNAIWVLDKYSVFTNQAKKYGFKNIITDDFLLWDSKDMKFDLVMGNPPYKYYQQFFNLAVKSTTSSYHGR